MTEETLEQKKQRFYDMVDDFYSWLWKEHQDEAVVEIVDGGDCLGAIVRLDQCEDAT